MIELSYSVAVQVGRDGRPTERALEAWAWIADRLDWTLERGPIPLSAIRAEFYLSFEWCCRFLDEKASTIREQGLQPKPAVVLVSNRRPAREWVQGLLAEMDNRGFANAMRLLCW